MMPRIKKGYATTRAAFQRRPISDELAAVLDQVIEQNAALDPPTGVMPMDRPLFIREWPLEDVVVARVQHNWFYKAVSAMPEQLGLVDDEGMPLRLYPRRLRYTFAKRHVEAGVKPEVLMELLDHTSLATILVYYNPRMDLVLRLDATLDSTLAPLASALTRSEDYPSESVH